MALFLDTLENIALQRYQLESGNIVLFQVNETLMHCGIIGNSATFIHAQEKTGVVETRLTEKWQSRLGRIYQFKELIMVALALSGLGTAVGASLGFGTLGSTILATSGALAGTYIENSLLGVGNEGSNAQTEPFVNDDLLVSGYGKAIPLVYGTARTGGNVLWMSEAETTTINETQRVRTGKFSSKTVTTGTERFTEVDLAIGLCAVPYFEPEEELGLRSRMKKAP